MRELFTESEITLAYNKAVEEDASRRFSIMAKRLTDLGRGEVSRQNARHWSLLSIQQEVLIKGEDELTLMRERRLQQTNNNKLRARERYVMDGLNELALWKEGIADAVAKLNIKYSSPVPDYMPELPEDATPLTLEILVSDIQFGKVDVHYNTEIARKRVREIARMARLKVYQYRCSGYYVERLVVALMGDIIESADKHPDSALACDSSTPEQMSNAIESLYSDLLQPLSALGIIMDVYCVGGNHDKYGQGMSFFKAGRTLLSYPIYTSLELVTQAAGLTGIKFIIPETPYTLYDIYGSTVLVEHGVGWKNTDVGMRDMKAKRAEQLGMHLDYARIGHLHSLIAYNAGQHLCNGATFGSGDGGYEYSSAMGYSSEAAQWLVAHCPKGNRKNTTFELVAVQLGHIK